MARVDYVDPEDLPADYRDLVVSSLQPGKTVNVYRAIANNPEALDGLRTFLGALWTDSGLEDRQREVIILAVSRDYGSGYEWHQHVNIARDAGLDDAEIRALGAGELEGFPPEERLLVEYARAVIRDEVTNDLHDRLAAEFDAGTCVGAAALAAGYAMLAALIAALGVETEDPFVGWGLEDA